LLLAAGLPLPRHVFAHGYLTVGGKKMSKTNLTGISPTRCWTSSVPTAIATTSCGRGRSGRTGAFSYEAMLARYNADLANDLGNW